MNSFHETIETEESGCQLHIEQREEGGAAVAIDSQFHAVALTPTNTLKVILALAKTLPPERRGDGLQVFINMNS